ncbi:MAG: hypothetical protein ABJR05_02915 [Balneola sp.]
MYDIKKAGTILEENISSIGNITQWAMAVGYEKTSKFSWEFRKHFGVRPSEVFIEIKVENILKYMATFPEEKNYCISLEFGFANEKALYKFLKRHTQKTPTQLRKGIAKKG